ncbi:Do family serine endopeptidase [Sphingomicrobium astaxanthinifaciens]|uniref:Do family serine endopeptidase n=1 Tax=Sphingomicrobium astaxanthinifaciens TaxID=1227949 RepID=UPI001FCCBE1B|nr:Do family serine endopeptidase [Sphingomicrobium astaxanthinifaciens]MCJ7421583.1 Do family serine endopeptidase [Sphingomicrobium astaxanthinifaciens]
MAKEMTTVRYVYGIAAALLLGGSAYSMTGGTLAGQEAQNAPRPVPVAGAPESFADLAARLQPAVVNISTRQEIEVQRRQQDPLDQFFRRFGVPNPRGNSEPDDAPVTRETGSLGSGFVISPDGYIVTNNHLIEGRGGNGGTVDEVYVTFPDRTEYEARIVGRDPDSDLAVLKIEGTNLPYVNWGDSDDVRVGDWIIAIGNPYGLGGTVTAGIVSALHRGITGFGAYDRYIQTDASINMGNSGGPMFDMAGNVIGINSALISPTGASVGIGLAIPAEAAKPVIESLRRGEAPERGYLGVSLQPLSEDIADALGLPKERGELVRSVVAGQAAEAAGLQRGDVILAIDGTPVTPDNTVSYLIANTPVGATVPLTIIRNGERRTVNVRVNQRPSREELAAQLGSPEREDGGMAAEDETPVDGGDALGMTLQPLTDQIRDALRLEPGLEGVIISRVDPNSDAARKGLQRGEVILRVNRQDVRNVDDVDAAVGAARAAGRDSVLVLVQRGRQPARYIGLELER